MRAPSYTDFNLVIAPIGDGRYSARVDRSPAGEGQDEFVLPPEVANTPNMLNLVGGAVRRMRPTAPVVEPLGVERFGQLLFKAVFGDSKIGQRWRDSRLLCHELRLCLMLDQAPELAQLPWEYLHDGSGFLALSNRTPVVRYLALPGPPPTMVVAPPLRILVVLADPTDCMPQLNVEGEWTQLNQALRSLVTRGQVELQPLTRDIGESTVDALRRVMRQGPWHAIHVVAHGWFDGDHGGLFLEDREGRKKQVAAEELFVEAIDGHIHLRLMVLNACDTAAQGQGSYFAGTAQRLVQLGVPTAVAMQFPISDRSAVELAREFYRAIADGYPIDAALADARKYLSSQSRMEWGTAVLFSRATDNTLLHVVPLPATSSDQQSLLSAGNPYRGMEPFERKHAANYFGREADVEKLLQKLMASKLVAVVGASGSGKSSLVRAGLANALANGALAGSQDWPFIVFKPSLDPLFSLAAELIQQARPNLDFIDLAPAARQLARSFLDSSQSLLDILHTWRSQKQFNCAVVVVDQFEEFFTYRSPSAKYAGGDSHGAFAQLLARLVEEQQWLRLVVTLRADYTGNLQELPRLGPLADSGWMNLLPMSHSDLRRAIEQPATGSNRRLEAGLVERLLEDLSEQPSQLPLLQFALTELWNRQDVAGLFTHSAYAEIGGLGGAITNYAEGLRARLDEAEQKRLPELFLRLVQPTPRGQGVEFVRQRIYVDDLPPDLQALLLQMANERLVVTDSDPTGRRTAEVVHEALLRRWPWLERLLRENQEFLLWHPRLVSRLEDWNRSGCTDTGALLDGGILTEAERWHETRPDGWSHDELAYLDASRQRRKETTERDLRQQSELKEAKLRAERNSRIALARGLASAAILELARPEDPSGSRTLLLASEAVRAMLPLNEPIGGIIQDAMQRAVDEATQFRAFIAPGFRTPSSDNPQVTIISSVAFSPDGRYVLTVGDNDYIRLWDISRSDEKWKFRAHEDRIWFATFSRDSRFIATASADGTACIWNVATAAKVQTLNGHTDHVFAAVFSGDGRFVATASADQTSRIWDIADGREVRCLVGHTDWVLSVVFSSLAPLVVTASLDQTVRLWHIDSGAVVSQFGVSTDLAGSVRFSQDGEYIVTTSPDLTARLLQIDRGAEIHHFAGHTDAVRFAALSPDGGHIVTTSDDRTACVWEVSTGSMVRQFRGHTASVLSADFSPDGRFVVTGGEDGTTRLWELASGRKARLLDGQGAGVLSANFSPDGQLVVTAGEDGTARIWKVESSVETHQIVGHEGKVLFAAFSNDGRRILTTGDDHVALIWDIVTDSDLPTPQSYATLILQGHKDIVLSGNFSRDSRYVVTAGADHCACVWEVDTGHLVVRLEGHDQWVQWAAFSSDNRFVVTASIDRTACIWDVASGQVVKRLVGHTNMLWSAAFSPDDRYILTASADQTARRWEAESGHEVVKSQLRLDTSLFAAFSNDGAYIAAANADSSVSLWELDTGRETRRLVGHTAKVNFVTFSPDKRFVVTASADRTAQVWLASIDSLVQQATQRIQRVPPDLTDDERQGFLLEL